MHLVHYLWALFTVFSILSKGFSFTKCFGLPPLSAFDFPVDCLAFSAHIPSLLGPIDEDDNPVRLESWNSPFFPQAVLNHGNCYARVSFNHGVTNPTLQDLFVSLHQAHWTDQRAPTVPLSERSIAKIWRSYKLAFQDLTIGCFVHGTIGISWRSINIPEMEEVMLIVEILGRDDRRVAKAWREETKAVLRGRSRSHRATGAGFFDKFKVTFLEIP